MQTIDVAATENKSRLATLPKVFDLFAQAQRSIDRAQGGLGIGLTLVKRLVELHGGTIEAFSRGQGLGSEFTVRLPMKGTGSGASQAYPLKSAHATSPQKILVVDDNEDAARTLGYLMQGEGHEVEVAYDGPSAVVKAIEFEPRIVVLDIGLPGMSGYEVAKRIRQQPGLKDTILIAVTGYGQEVDRQRSREAEIDHHFVKPVNIDQLNAVIIAAKPPAAGK